MVRTSVVDNKDFVPIGREGLVHEGIQAPLQWFSNRVGGNDDRDFEHQSSFRIYSARVGGKSPHPAPLREDPSRVQVGWLVRWRYPSG